MPDRPPDSWLTKNAHHLPTKGHILDLACGSGRNSRYLLSLGFRVTSLDKDTRNLSDLELNPDCTIVQADLENANPWPLSVQFDGIVVTNYLFRPLFLHIVESLMQGGVLIYKTFMEGNEKFGRPRNPEFLLKENELIEVFSKDLKILAFEQGYEKPSAMTQRICAVKPQQDCL